MGFITVKFLGDDYQISESVNDFLNYDKLLIPILNQIVGTVTSNLKRDSMLRPSASVDNIESDIVAYKKIMTDGADLLLKKLLDMDIYDVTVDDLIKEVTTFENLDNIALESVKKICAEGQQWLNMKKAGMENAYHYAAKNITGSGISIFTSSFSMLMIHSAIEKSIILSQAKKADVEYQKAMQIINQQVNDGLERMCKDIIFGEYYPSLINALMQYANEVMAAFLNQLISYKKFDFESVQSYNMRKSEEMLKNINHVSNKREFLKQAFLTCPFCVDVYEKCLEFGLLDYETFETASYFGMGDDLVDRINKYISINRQNVKIISPLVSILSYYRHCDESEIWKNIYETAINYIKESYKKYVDAVHNKKKLDEIIRNNIVNQMQDILNKTKEDIANNIKMNLNHLLSQEQYTEFIKLNILSPEDIRMEGSLSVELDDINNEIQFALVQCIMEYIIEAKSRWEIYKNAKKIFDEEIKKKEKELNDLKAEKSHLGLFAFARKKELSEKINAKVDEIADFKDKRDPIGLKEDFERMYK